MAPWGQQSERHLATTSYNDMKLTGTGGQADGQTGEQDHVLSQADALTKKGD